jgi:hypothetical protein
MLVDICLPRWVPYDSFNLNEDVPGSIAAPSTAMAYPWKHFIGGHMGRLGTRADMAVYQRYVDDIIAGVKQALVTVDPTPFFAKYGNNSWAAVQQYQAAQVDYAAAPVIKKYTGVLAVLAATALAEHHADPGYLVGRPPAREHRRRGPDPARRSRSRAGRDLSSGRLRKGVIADRSLVPTHLASAERVMPRIVNDGSELDRFIGDGLAPT